MDLNLINAIIPYGLTSLAIGVFIGIAVAIINFQLSKREREIDSVFTLAIGFVAFFLLSLIFGQYEIFSEEAVSAALLCGSLAAGFSVFIKNLKNGKTDTDLLKHVINCYVDAKSAKTLTSKIKDAALTSSSKDELSEKLTEILSESDTPKIAVKELVERIFNALHADKDKE